MGIGGFIVNALLLNLTQGIITTIVGRTLVLRMLGVHVAARPHRAGGQAEVNHVRVVVVGTDGLQLPMALRHFHKDFGFLSRYVIHDFNISLTDMGACDRECCPIKRIPEYQRRRITYAIVAIAVQDSYRGGLQHLYFNGLGGEFQWRVLMINRSDGGTIIAGHVFIITAMFRINEEE